MATVPVSGTHIHLLKGIPFNNDYKHTRWFESKAQQTNYFWNKEKVHSMTQANFQRIEGYHFVKVDKSIDELWGVNYMMFRNANYNDKWFYAFVTNIEYRQRNTTYVYFQIDVLQTWRFDMNFKPSFVVREHCPQYNDDGTPVINTIDEGLHYGTDLETVSVEHYKPFDDVYFMVIAMKSANHVGQGGFEYNNKIMPNVQGVPQPLTYYVHPFRIKGGYGELEQPKVNISGREYQPTGVVETLEVMFTMDTTVNNIVSLYITDYIGDNSIEYDADTDTVHMSPSTNYTGTTIDANIDGDNREITTVYVENLDNFTPYEHNMGNKYDGFHDVSESKLLMYPYCVTILDDFKGNRIEIKNEYIRSKDLRLHVFGSLGAFNKTAYFLPDYLTENLNDETKKLMGLETALVNENPNDLPVLSDNLTAYMQGNRNSLQTHLKQTATNAIYNAAGDAVGGIGSALMRNPIGAVTSGVNVAQGLHNTQLEIEKVQSKMKDVSNIPPNISNMGGNTYFEYGNGYHGVYVIKKQITPEYRKRLSDYFNMFGYKIHEVKLPNFHTRKNWNYIETKSCVITGDFNNEDLQELKNVFDSGITLWHDDDIGNYDRENGVI